MKKVYISCYQNNDFKFKDTIIKWNKDRNYTLFKPIDSKEEDFYSFKKVHDNDLINSIKAHILRDSDVAIFLIGKETHKRMTVDWECRAAMYNADILKKCGLIIVYLPEIVEQYGPNKIPRTVLPKILQKNISSPDVFVVETTWQTFSKDINNLEKYLNSAYAYGQMSHYILDNDIMKRNITILK